MTTVSQEARDAYLSMNMLPEFDAADVRAGRWDNTTGLQAFAKFEQSIRQSAERGEVDRLRSELNKVRGILERLRDFDGWHGTFHAGHAYDAKQDAIAYLEGTSHAEG